MRKAIVNSLVKAAGLGALSVLLLALAVSAKAQCGTSFESVMSAIAASKGQTKLAKSRIVNTIDTQNQFLNDKSVNTSIVGLWRIKFLIDTPNGPLDIQDAFQIWNEGGTEVHNPKVDPRSGSVCLGSWVQQAPLTFSLTHRVWLYDASGNFQVIGKLTETLTLGDRGATQSGWFSLQPVDDNDQPLGDALTGHVVGYRITP